ncbi:MAG: hypothetical protein ABI768_06415 [Acidobacteriota bacterium]
MKTASGLALAVFALAALPATAQIKLKTPAPIVSPTPTPGGFQPLDPSRLGPKEVPPTRTPIPTRTATPTPVPLDERYAGPKWGPASSDVPIVVRRLDARSQCKTESFFFNSGMFYVSIDCYSQGRGPLGLKADVDVANGTRLKNGWKVKSVAINFWDGTQPLNPDSHHGFRVTRQPAVGSDDPSVALHLFAEGFNKITVRGGVMLEGPHGTTPW